MISDQALCAALQANPILQPSHQNHHLLSSPLALAFPHNQHRDSRLRSCSGLSEGLFAAPMLKPPLLLDLVPISRYDTASRIDGSSLYLRLRPNTSEGRHQSILISLSAAQARLTGGVAATVAELIEQGGAKLVQSVRGGSFEAGWPHGAEVPLHLYELPWVYQVCIFVRKGQITTCLSQLGWQRIITAAEKARSGISGVAVMFLMLRSVALGYRQQIDN
eukprot:209374-Rhodomonas_salina.1